MRIVRNNDENSGNLEKHFRELRNLEIPPSPDLWDKLEDKLEEDKARVKHDHWYKALILLLIPFTVINILVTYELSYPTGERKGSKPDGFTQNILSSKNALSGTRERLGGWGIFFKEGFFSGSAFIKDNQVKKDAISEPVKQEISPVHTASFTEATEDETSIIIQNAPPLIIEKRMAETSVTYNDLLNYHARKMLDESVASVKGLHFGIEGGINNSWMLHKDNSLHPLIGNKIHRKFDMGTTYGFSLGYDFSHRYGIEAEFILKSRQGQEYRELRYGKIPVNGEVNLDYLLVPVLFKYKWTKASPRSLNPRVLNLIAGIQYGRLRHAEVVQNGLDLEKVSELFNRDELGLLLGIEYDLFVHPKYFLSMGARASISTDAGAFPYFNSEKTGTYNMLIGMNASFNYLVQKRR